MYGRSNNSARQAASGRYGDYCNLARANGINPMPFHTFNDHNRTMTQTQIVGMQMRDFKPSPDQWMAINRIQINVGVRFYGRTKDDATAFISRYISDSRAAEARRSRHPNCRCTLLRRY